MGEVAALFSKPLAWLLSLLTGLIAYVWHDNKNKVKENTEKVEGLKDKLADDYYSKDQVDERIAFAIEPVRDAMVANTDAIKELTKAVNTLHTDMAVQKAKDDS